MASAAAARDRLMTGSAPSLGALGARPVQMWKETLREDFARDDDNYSSGAHDANLDQLRKAMGGTDFFSDIE